MFKLKGHLEGQRPAKHDMGNSDTELADEEPIRDTNRKRHFEIVTEQPTSASNRKLQCDKIAHEA